ncbi:MAG TPA: hypothetical protein VFA70_05145, partial [Dehalococcoidia bacterium]|nr:hypothetical protein [Dehalococcoidia bacterium]
MESATCLAHLTPATVAMSREHTVFLMPAPGLAWQILRHLLSAIPGTVIVGEAETTAAALDAIPTLAPDLVLSSPVLGGESTMHALAALHRACPTTSVALFAADLAPPVLGQFIRAGVRGYLSWELDA